MPPLAQWLGFAAITAAALTWPVAACLCLGGALLLTILATQTPRLP